MKYRAGILSILIGFSLVSQAQAVDWFPDNYKNQKAMGWGYRIADKVEVRNSGLIAMGLSGPKDKFGRGGMQICSSLTDSKCSSASSISAYSIFGRCADQIESFACVERTQLNGKSLIFDSYTSNKKVFDQDSKAILPEGSSFQIWKTADTNPRYFVSLVETRSVVFPQNSFQYGAPLSFAMQEVRPIPCASCTNSLFRIFPSTDGVAMTQDYEDTRVSTGDCYLARLGTCFEKVEMNSNDDLKIEVRIPAVWASWYFGRIDSPKITEGRIETYSNVQTKSVEISGRPTHVPVVGEFSTDLASVPPVIYGGNSRDSSGTPLGIFNPNMSGSSAIAWSVGQSWSSVGDKINSSTMAWSLRSVNMIQNPKCNNPGKSSSFLGVVYTNALLYSDGAPTFSDSEFNYKVAGRHLDVDGKPVIGMYGLMLAKDYAECLYGRSILNSKATLSIVDESSGQSSITTSIIKTDGDFFNFYTSGFTFSTKTINVKVSPPDPVEVTPKPDTRKVSENLKSKTIKCSRTSRSKLSITGTNPKCPAGYKKVS